MRATSSSSATSTVIPTPSGTRPRRLVGAVQVGDDDARALGGEPVGDRAADALRRAGDDRDLAVEAAHQRIGENEVGIEDAVLLGVEQRLEPRPRKSFHSGSACSAARRCSRSA